MVFPNDIIVIVQYGIWCRRMGGAVPCRKVLLLACVVEWLCNGWCALDELRTGWRALGDSVHVTYARCIIMCFF